MTRRTSTPIVKLDPRTSRGVWDEAHDVNIERPCRTCDTSLEIGWLADQCVPCIETARECRAQCTAADGSGRAAEGETDHELGLTESGKAREAFRAALRTDQS